MTEQPAIEAIRQRAEEALNDDAIMVPIVELTAMARDVLALLAEIARLTSPVGSQTLLTPDERRRIKDGAHRAINTPDLEWARDMVMFLAYSIMEYDAALSAVEADLRRKDAALRDLSNPKDFPEGEEATLLLGEVMSIARAALAVSPSEPVPQQADPRFPHHVEGCICPRFGDIAPSLVADLTCPVHGVDGTDPGDVEWYCTRCGGEGVQESDRPGWEEPGEFVNCHACGGSGNRRDQRVF